MPIDVVLPVAVHADHQDYLRLAIHLLHGLLVRRIQDRQQLVLEHALQLLHVRHLLAIDLLAQRIQHRRRRRRTQVGCDQRGLQIVERLAIDLLAERHHVFNALAEALARARYRLFHALQETGLLFCAAEQGLDHE